VWARRLGHPRVYAPLAGRPGPARRVSASRSRPAVPMACLALLMLGVTPEQARPLIASCTGPARLADRPIGIGIGGLDGSSLVRVNLFFSLLPVARRRPVDGEVRRGIRPVVRRRRRTWWRFPVGCVACWMGGCASDPARAPAPAREFPTGRGRQDDDGMRDPLGHWWVLSLLLPCDGAAPPPAHLVGWRRLGGRTRSRPPRQLPHHPAPRCRIRRVAPPSSVAMAMVAEIRNPMISTPLLYGFGLTFRPVNLLMDKNILPVGSVGFMVMDSFL
jgi:hypothetical protein